MPAFATIDSSSSSAVVSPSMNQVGRETVESIVVAIILAFLFRSFVAEAFVIPTGSMAPTLQGRHMDVVCPACGFQSRTGASQENTDQRPATGEVTRARCALCRYAFALDKETNANHHSFMGDRILVSKFAYQFAEPERWDVIVFKYPGDAKVNYIKRLVGLPHETLLIQRGDIHVLDPATKHEPEPRQRFVIARKPPHKVVGMLQLVDDTLFVPRPLVDADWPARWAASVGSDCRAVTTNTFEIPAAEREQWLRYRHLISRREDWRRVKDNEPLSLDGYAGQLISDYYAYNDDNGYETDDEGLCWVGDLALEADLDVRGATGHVLLDVVEGGTHFRATIDVATGRARLSTDGQVANVDGATAEKPRTANTALRGPGRIRVRFANVDDQLFLWLDDRIVEFDGPTTFVSPKHLRPCWSPSDPGDLQPLGIGARGVELGVLRLRVLRDVYYRADSNDGESESSVMLQLNSQSAVMANPTAWSTSAAFDSKSLARFHLDADQYFPLGDNSPQSKDGRLWSNSQRDPPPFVHRDLLIGQAVAIYWPHAWRIPWSSPRHDAAALRRGSAYLPIPNYQRIGLIR